MAETNEFDDVPWVAGMEPTRGSVPFEIVNDGGELARVPSRRLGLVLAQGASPATKADLEANKKRRELQDEMKRQTGTVPYTLETLRRYSQAFMGGYDVFRPITKGLSHIATAAGLADKPVTDEDYDRVMKARQALAPAGTQTAAELLGYLSPMGLEAAAAKLGRTAAASAATAMSAAGVEARAAAVAEGTMTAAEAAAAAARAEAAAAVATPQLAARLASQTAAGKAAMLSPLTWMGKAGSVTAGAAEQAVKTVLPDLGAAGEAARFFLPRIAGGAMEGALFGAGATAEEISAGRVESPEQAVENLAANMKGHAVLFGAIGAGTGVLEKAFTAGADNALRFGKWWKEESPFPWSHKSVLESWKLAPDQTKVATARMLAENPMQLSEFVGSVKNGTALLLDSTPAQAAWMIENREALAAVAKREGPAGVNMFRGFEADGQWDAELATQMLRDYPRMVSKNERNALVAETVDGMNKMLQFGDGAMHAMNSRLLRNQRIAMQEVGGPGGPPSNEAIHEGVMNAGRSVADAIAEAEANPAKYSEEFVNILRSTRAELNKEIRGVKAADVSFDSVSDAIAAVRKDSKKYGEDTLAALREAASLEEGVAHKIATGDAEIKVSKEGTVIVSRWKAKPAFAKKPDGTIEYDAEAAYDALRKVRTNLNEAIADQNAKYTKLSSSQKQAMNLLEGTAGQLAFNIHNMDHWGEFAVVRSQADELMAKYLENLVEGGAFADSFLMKKVVGVPKGLADATGPVEALRQKQMFVVDPNKLDRYFKDIGGFRAETQTSAQGGYAPSQALARFRSDFASFIQGVERVTPNIATEATNARMTKDQLEDFISRFNSNLNATSERMSITRAFDEATETAAMRFGTRYEGRGSEEPLQRSVEKTVFGSALKLAKTVFVKSPEWQWQLEPRLRAMAASAKMGQYVDQRVESFAKTLAEVATSLKPAAQIALTKTPIGEVLGTAQVAMPATAAKKKEKISSDEQRENDREEYIKQVKQARKLATDVNALADRVNDLMGPTKDPEMHRALAMWVQQAAQEIADAAPSVPLDNNRFVSADDGVALTESGEKYVPSEEEMEEHKRVVAATTGLGLLELAQQGRLTQREVRIADRLVPGLMLRMRIELQKQLDARMAKGERIQPAYRSAVETLLDRSLDPASTPAISAKTQRVYSRIRMGKAEAEGDRAMPSSRAKSLNTSDTYKTPMQRANQR